MGSDRARLSIDPRRGYRTVVAQQGRVTLEADTNEAVRLAETQLREDVIDIVGPSGTPDDGYKLSVAGDGSFRVGPGTYYLGGWRVTQSESVTFGSGPDDLDLPVPALADGSHAFGLLLTEQEISAVEDRALLEIALGGPDTGQRTRLMQRVVSVPTQDLYCSDAAAAWTAALDAEGAALDAATAAIVPSARLRVVPIAPAAPADPCDPPAVGGYLGADNQLIRVSVVAYDPATGRGRLVWGFDNAATLYRVTTANGRTLTLQSDPIDAAHAPRLGQAVEVLRTRTRLGNGDVIAADAGLVSAVDQPYDPDLRSVRIAATIPAGERGDADHPLFLRLWEDTEDFIAGDLVPLGETGLGVRVSLDALGGGIVARPYWCFAARPATPLLVYPRRYLDAGQPPEGPRQWLAPLATARVSQRQGSEVTDDCRETFVPLTKIKPGCCGISIDPGMSGRRDVIQRALDSLKGTRGTVTLKPGRYTLRKPLRLTAEHKGLTLEGCSEGVFLEAADDTDPAFAAGLIVLEDVNEVTLRKLQLQLPLTPLPRKALETLPDGDDDGRGDSVGGYAKVVGSTPVAIGVNATGCAQLVIEDCQFRFRLRPDTGIFGVGLLLRGECWGLSLRRNRFLHDDDFKRYADDVFRLMFGIALLPAVELAAMARGGALPKLARLDTLIDDGDIYDNEFAGLTVAALGFARFGTLRIERNHVHKCEGGFMLADSHMAASGAVFGSALLPFVDRLLVIAIATAALIPDARPEPFGPRLAEVRKLRSEALTRADDLYRSLANDGGDNDSGLDAEEVPPLYRTVSVFVSASTRAMTPHLMIANNAFDVVGQFDRGNNRNNDDNQASGEFVTFGAAALANRRAISSGKIGLGLPALSLAFEYVEVNRDSEDVGDLLITSNRFHAAVGTAVRILLPERMAFASNMVRGGAGQKSRLLEIFALDRAMIEIMANVVDGASRIEPPTRPVTPSSDWQFVNRMG